MINSYWELYVAYIDKCVRDNLANGIDPHHYEMEWNHFLPKAVFPDLPIGQWLTLKQHAIASALQTLVFKKNCMCGWHKKHLSESLLREAWPYARMSKNMGEENPMYGKKRPDLAVRNREKTRSGESHPMHGKKRPDLSQRNKDSCPSRGTKWFNNGQVDKRCIPGTEPPGFVSGRLLMRRPDKSSGSLLRR